MVSIEDEARAERTIASKFSVTVRSIAREGLSERRLLVNIPLRWRVREDDNRNPSLKFWLTLDTPGSPCNAVPSLRAQEEHTPTNR